MDQLQVGDVRISRVVEFSGPVGLTTGGFFPQSDPRVRRENRERLSPHLLDTADDHVQTAVQTWVLRSGAAA